MLNVLTMEEALRLVKESFSPLSAAEEVPLSEALDRIVAADVEATEYVPDFDRSTVDGYALRARDTFGCSDAIPALLTQQAQVLMGQGADFVLKEGCCAAVPTGGAVPAGADGVCMLEYAEDYGDGTVGVGRPVAPGENMIFRGDDVLPGKLVLKAGHILRPQDIGALAAMGAVRVPVKKPVRAAILSTGDELIPPDQKPGPGQIRDVNGPLVAAQLTAMGVEPVSFGIVPDEEETLREAVGRALESCDAVILSGGSSVGVKDAAARVISSFGPVLFHGLAIKPGKPTILGQCGNKPLVGLPGHPVAAFFVTELLVRPLMGRLMGRELSRKPVAARLTENVSANHGRALYCACRLKRENGALWAEPVRTKSGLITALTAADGYFSVERDREGLMAGSEIQVYCVQENRREL